MENKQENTNNQPIVEVGENGKEKENAIDTLAKKTSRFIGKVDQKLGKVKLFHSLPVVQRRIFIIISLIFLSIISVIIFFGIIFRLVTGRTPKLRLNPTPDITSITPPPKEVRNPSKYATDREVLELEAEIKQLESKANSTLVEESTLSVPLLNFEVEF